MHALKGLPGILVLAITVLSAPQSALGVVPVRGVVFADHDGDGIQDLPGENGVPGVVVSDGIQVTTTDAAGRYDIAVNPVVARFAFISTPSGYRNSTPFYHQFHQISAPDTANFGLLPDSTLAGNSFVFAQITDIEIEFESDGPDLRRDIDELVSAVPRPAFLVGTGDLVNRGDQRILFKWYKQAFEGYPLPMHHVYGNHDSRTGTPAWSAYEDSLGPNYYSFNHCGSHFVVLNSIDYPTFQASWLQLDVAAMPAGSRLFILQHTAPTAGEFGLYKSLGTTVTLNGHWHGNRVRMHEGILDINTPNISWPGMDHSPRGFQLIHVEPDTVWCEYRWGGFDDYVKLVSPPNGGDVSLGRIPLRVSAYDTSQPVTRVRMQVNGPQGFSREFTLVRESPWSYGTVWDATTGVLPGTYTGTITVIDTFGVSRPTAFLFRVKNAAVPAVSPGADWAMAQGDPARTGRAVDVVTPPLSVAWIAPAGGEPAMASPVLKDGVVYQGTGRTTDWAECGVSAIDAVTGQRLWRRVLPNAVKNAVTVTGQSVYAVTVNGQLWSLERATGAVQWMKTLGDTAVRWEHSSPSIAGNTVYAGRATRFTAFDMVTGLPRWFVTPSWDFVPWDYPRAVISGNRIVLSSSHGLFGVNRSTGAIDWTVNGYWRDGAARNDTVFVAGGDFQHQWLSARRVSDGSMLWQSPVDLRTGLSTPALSDSLLVVGSGTGEIQAYNTRNGAQRWVYATGNGITSTRPFLRESGDIVAAPVISGPIAYAGSTDGKLYGINVLTGVPAWSYDFGIPLRAAPAVSGNALFLAADDGCVYALVEGTVATDVGAGAGTGGAAEPSSLTSPCPLRRGDYIRFASPREETGELLVIDVRGRVVRRCYQGPVGPEPREFHWDGRSASGRDLAPGVYFVLLRTPTRESRSKVMLER